LLNLLRRAINTGNVLVTRLSQEVEERSATAAKVKNPRVSIGWKVPADQTPKVRRTLRSFVIGINGALVRSVPFIQPIAHLR
jgi:hypothetical protein